MIGQSDAGAGGICDVVTGEPMQAEPASRGRVPPTSGESAPSPDQSGMDPVEHDL